MRKIAFMNQKGGVGKTTSAINVAAGLAERGRRVLLVDLDPQSNLTMGLNQDPRKLPASVYQVLTGAVAAAEAVRPSPYDGLDLIPAEPHLAGAEVELVSEVGRETILREKLDELLRQREESGRPYDYLLVDCPPSLGLLSINALTTVSEIFIPLQAEFFALQGMGKLFNLVNMVKRRLNPPLRVTGIIVCRFNSRTHLGRDVVQEVESHFPGLIFKSRVRDNIRIAESPSHGQSIMDYDPRSHGANDYRALVQEILAQE